MISKYFERKYTGKEQRLQKALSFIYPELTYSELMKLLRKKDIYINGKTASINSLLVSCDIVKLYYQPSAIKIKVVYSDDNVIIAYKGRGIVSDGDCSFEGLVKYKYGDNCALLHRLDTNTDGILIFSKNNKAYEAILAAMKEGKIEKYYHARVNGIIKQNRITLEGYLQKDSDKGLVKIFNNPVKGASFVKCEVKVLDYEDNSTNVEVMILGGKTHQIRAQLAAFGHFILGDSKYGNDEINKKYGFKKQQLTAYKIVFRLNKNADYSYLNNLDIHI